MLPVNHHIVSYRAWSAACLVNPKQVSRHPNANQADSQIT